MAMAELSLALHGVMTAQLAARESREVIGEEEPMFYNPMWSYFGDRSPGPPGSYYLRSSKPLNYFWLMLDQVLLRPSLAPALTEVGIVDHDGGESLLTANGLRDA